MMKKDVIYIHRGIADGTMIYFDSVHLDNRDLFVIQVDSSNFI